MNSFPKDLYSITIGKLIKEGVEKVERKKEGRVI